MILFVGGGHAFGALVISVLIGFVLDMMNLSEGFLMSIWFSLIWVSFNFAHSSNALFDVSSSSYVFLLLNSSILILSIGLWASINFIWFQKLLPGICVVFERLLFSLSGLMACSWFSFFGLQYFGEESGPFVMFFIQHVVFTVMFLPKESAFREKVSSVPNEEYFILSYPEAGVTLFVYMFFPALLSVALFHSIYISIHHFSNLVILLCLPLIGFRMLWNRRPFWMFESTPSLHGLIHSATLFVPCLVMPIAICFRVFFPSFLHDLHVPFPFGHLLFIVLAYGVAGVLLAHHFRVIRIEEHPIIVYAVTAIAAVVVGIVLNAPFFIIVFGMLGAVSFVWFYFSKMLIPFAASLAFSTLCLGWFLSTKLAFITFHFDRMNIPLREVLGLLSSVFVLSFIVIGMFLSRQSRLINDALFLVYSISFALAEWILGMKCTTFFFVPAQKKKK